MEDTSKILSGQPHGAQHGAHETWEGLAFSDLLYYILITVSLGLTLSFLRTFYTQLRDKKYRKNLRRRYGIPDHDCRPFAVALAAARGAHLKQGSKKSFPSSVHNGASYGSQAAPQRHIQRQRRAATGLPKGQQVDNGVIFVPSRSPSYVESQRIPDRTAPTGAADLRLYVNSLNGDGSTPPVARGPTPSSVNNDASSGSQTAPQQHIKRQRRAAAGLPKGQQVDGRTAPTGAADLRRYVNSVNGHASTPPVARGPKRTADADSGEGFETKHGDRSNKRARQNSIERGFMSAATVRRQKLHLAEAGSTAAADGHAGGRKRGREVSSTDSGSDSPAQLAARHIRGKRVRFALCEGPSIGEEWQSGGIWYKVGPNGQRLRRANVRSLQQAFHMPKDSVHPDRSVGYEVYVQEWRTEEEHTLAKERQEIWEPPISSSACNSDVNSSSEVSSPTKGKALLYPSSSAKNVIAPNGRNIKQSLTPNGTRVNPVNSFPIRRVSAIQSIGPVDLVGNSNLRATRTFSKWEKQERELEALSLAHLSKKEEPVNAMKRQTGALLESTPTLLLGNGSGPSQQPPAAFANAPATTSTNRISFTIPVDSKIDTPATAKLSTVIGFTGFDYPFFS